MYNVLPFIKSFGIYCPISAIKYDGDFNIGDIGGAYKFIDFLSQASFPIWKISPITDSESFAKPIDPYFPISEVALDPIYINLFAIPEFNAEQNREQLDNGRNDLYAKGHIPFSEVRKFKDTILLQAFEIFYNDHYQKETDRAKEFKLFVEENSDWIESYGLYKAIANNLKQDLSEWSKEYKKKLKPTIDAFAFDHRKEIIYHEYVQWIVFKQWNDIKEYALEKGVYFIIELPYYLNVNAVPVWDHPELFDVDENLNPNWYGGLPSPDDNPEKAKTWVTCLYNWEKMKEENYSWWEKRIKHTEKLFDAIVLNNFNGFIKYWKVNPKSKKGKWENGPGIPFLNLIAKECIDKNLTMVYADGYPDEKEDFSETRKRFGLEGLTTFIYNYMDILQNNVDPKSLGQITAPDSYSLRVWWVTLSYEAKKAVLLKLKKEVNETNLNDLTDDVRLKIIEDMLAQPFSTRIIAIQDFFEIEQQAPANPGDARWTFRILKRIEELLGDSSNIMKLKSYANLFTLKEDSFVSIPLIYPEVSRYYKQNEEIILSVLAPKETNIVAITDLPLNADPSNNMKELAFTKISENASGVFYQLRLQASKPGIYNLLISSKDNSTIKSFSNKLEIIIESEKGVFKRLFNANI